MADSSATIHVSPTNTNGRNPPSFPAKKFCSHCQRDKPAENFEKPGTDEILKTCVGCREGRAANRVREGGKRRRSGPGVESTRKLRRSTVLSASSPVVLSPTPAALPRSATPGTISATTASDLEAFGASLGRLSQLLRAACETLPRDRVVALGKEIHHDWRVDEMATFVEGFLKGASETRGW